MTRAPQHDHPIDGTRHDDCQMCQLIVQREAQARHDRNATTALDRYTDLTARTNAKLRARRRPPPRLPGEGT